MRRIMMLLAVAIVMSAMVVYSGVAWAEPKSCLATASANPPGGGSAEPGQTGSRARFFAESSQKGSFGQTTSHLAQSPGPCSPITESGPPGAFDPKATP